jgi:hypothetical protein
MVNTGPRTIDWSRVPAKGHLRVSNGVLGTSECGGRRNSGLRCRSIRCCGPQLFRELWILMMPLELLVEESRRYC